MMPKKKTEKPQDSKKTLRRLWSYLYEYKGLLLAAAILMMVSNIFALVGPLLSGYAIDAIQPGLGKVIFDRVFFYCGLMLLFYLASSLLSYLISLMMIRLSQRVVAAMRKAIFDKITELPVGYFDRVATGDIISRISYDVDTINTSLASDAIQVLSSLVTIIGSFVMMVLISPLLVLIFVVTVPASIFLTRFLMSKFQPLFRRRSRKLGELNGFVEEIISGQQTIKLYNQEEAIISRFDEKKPRSGGCLLQCRVLRQYDWSFHQLYQQSVVVLDQYVWRLAVFVRSSDIRECFFLCSLLQKILRTNQ